MTLSSSHVISDNRFLYQKHIAVWNDKWGQTKQRRVCLIFVCFYYCAIRHNDVIVYLSTEKPGNVSHRKNTITANLRQNP